MPFTQGFYINGTWQLSNKERQFFPLVNPATEEVLHQVPLATPAEVDEAIEAAHQAFNDYSQTPLQERIALVERILALYQERSADLATAISTEMGAPITLAQKAQVPLGIGQIQATLTAAKQFAFEEQHQGYQLRYEAAGVAALITPWNWPMNQALCKIAPALLAGCTVIFKPSELAPLSALLLSQIIADAKPPKGVFNMIFGGGEIVGPQLSSDPRVDLVSLTGSNRAGTSVLKEAANSIKRVSLELGGKSANILLPHCQLEEAVNSSIRAVMNNTGQSCNAPTRLLVPEEHVAEVEQLAQTACAAIQVGNPSDSATRMGPIANQRQYERVKAYITLGLEEGATLITGGIDRPAHLSRGYYIAPTVFSQVDNNMRIAQEEIFGPVLCIIPYRTVDEAIALANHTIYGLSAYVYGQDMEDAHRVANQLRAGNVHINNARAQLDAPFGGYKQSGIGREWGEHGLLEFLEKKAVFSPE